MLNKHNSDCYWRVNDQIFFSKALAVEYASRTNQQIHFNFFNNFFDQIDWTVEPEQSLENLYKDRAEQILSKYDYVILLLSGGSDSTNMVKTFLNNNLKPQEVISYGVLNKVVNERSKTNIEVTLSASKTAKLCQDMGVPYRFINLWENIENVRYDEKFFETADSRMCIDNLIKIEGLHYDKKILNIANSGKKVCLVSGLEKPRVFIHNGYFTTAYLDNPLTANFWAMDLINNNGIYSERFYTTIDMPKINIKQCFTIINYFEKNVPNYREKLIHTDKFDFQGYYNICNDILYPNTWKNKDYFSLQKSPNSLWCHKYNFFTEKFMNNSNMFIQYKGLINDFYRNINKKKYVKQNGDLTGFYGNFYKIKKVLEKE